MTIIFKQHSADGEGLAEKLGVLSNGLQGWSSKKEITSTAGPSRKETPPLRCWDDLPHFHFQQCCDQLLLGRASASPTVTCWLGLSSFAIYIYIYKSSVQPLGFVPAKSEPKSRANPVLRLCLPLALIDDEFLSKGCRFKSPVLCFFPHCTGCSAALWDKLDLNFFDKRSFLSLPVFHTQEIDAWRPNFSFRLQWPLIDWDLSAVFGEDARTHWEHNQHARNRILNVETNENELEPWAVPPFRLLSAGPCLHLSFTITASPCIAWQVARDRWHLLERARLHFHRPKRSVPSKARPTMLAFPSL